MAEEQNNGKIYALTVAAGIKRDGTVFDAVEYTDGEWCRFQRGMPKKIGGYKEMFGSFNGIQRGMIANSYNGVNYVFAGNANTLDAFVTGQSYGLGSGPYTCNLEIGYSPFPLKTDTITNTTTDFTITSVAVPVINYVPYFPIGTKLIFNDQSTVPTIYTVTGGSFITPGTNVTFTPALPVGYVITKVFLADYYFQPDPRLTWQFDYQYNPLGGSLNLVAHPGLNLDNIDNGVQTQVYYGSTAPDANEEWTFQGLADTTGQQPTYKPIVCDGGVVVLYPFIFVYGSNGFIANNNVDQTLEVPSLTDWNGPLANQVNVAAGKIVRGLPMRGGNNSPSGLFWATDSLIRVSFVNNPPTYWSYDLISSQISIMSSNAVVEMEGLYYWMGVDRFYMYNGRVSVLPNDKNVNWLFDNINFSARQKVWATKVPRYNEIWFFYPRGGATECTDAIIYNTKDNLWYDAGSAKGAQRSCGYTTSVFPYPVWADWNYRVTYSPTYNTVLHPASLPAPTSTQFYLSGDVTPAFFPGAYFSFQNAGNPDDPVYKIETSEFIINPTIGAPGVTLVTATTIINPYPNLLAPVYTIASGYPIWQHEFGYDEITLNDVNAIRSSFTTCDIGWIGGSPAQRQAGGINRRMHLTRIEPNFDQRGTMSMTVNGRKFASSQPEVNGPYFFDPDTDKIDLRLEHREITLKFESNTLGGAYQLGKTMITPDFGDERP